MEAPEKIYMTPSFGEPDNVLLASFSKSHLDFHRDIEYTQTDAFIKKAANYLNYILYDRVEIKKPGKIIPSLCAKGEFIEDFINYMKGE